MCGMCGMLSLCAGRNVNPGAAMWGAECLGNSISFTSPASIDTFVSTTIRAAQTGVDIFFLTFPDIRPVSVRTG
jgi:hypothetical protein